MVRTSRWVRLWHTDLFGDPWFRDDLNAEQQGVYLLLLMHQANRGGILPRSPCDLARLLRQDIRRFTNRYWRHFEPKFEPVGDGIGHPKMVAECREADRRVEQAHNANEAKARNQASSRSTSGSTSGPTQPEPEPKVLPEGSTGPRSKKKAEQHPHALKLCEFLASEIESWSPGRKTSCTSTASLRAMDGLVRIDKRSAREVALTIRWLFRAYEPQDAKFDWRPNIASGAKLRKQWDLLQDLRGGAVAYEKTEDQAFLGR